MGWLEDSTMDLKLEIKYFSTRILKPKIIINLKIILLIFKIYLKEKQYSPELYIKNKFNNINFSKFLF